MSLIGGPFCGVPSIVAALFIYALCIATLGFPRSGFAVSLALVLLMIPVIVRSTEEMLLIVPNDRKRPAPTFLGLNFFGNHTVVDDPKVALPTSWVTTHAPGTRDNRATDAGRGAQADVWAADEVIGQGASLVKGPGLEGGHELALVNQPVLQRQQAEEQVAVRGEGGHGEAPGCEAASDPAGHRAGARARGASHWSHYRTGTVASIPPRAGSDRPVQSALFEAEGALLYKRAPEPLVFCPLGISNALCSCARALC